MIFILQRQILKFKELNNTGCGQSTLWLRGATSNWITFYQYRRVGTTTSTYNLKYQALLLLVHLQRLFLLTVTKIEWYSVLTCRDW